MPKYSHPERPADASVVAQHLRELVRLYERGRWDLIGLTKWLDNDLDTALEAAERMEEREYEQFPDVEERHGVSDSHYHKAG